MNKKMKVPTKRWHDIQANDIQHNDEMQNDIQK